MCIQNTTRISIFTISVHIVHVLMSSNMCNFVKLFGQRRLNKMVSERFGNQFKQTNHLDHERTRTIKNVSRPNEEPKR